jgi:ABC-2 type transport system permease protein
MKKVWATLWAEYLKILKSRILPGSVIFFILVSSMMALVMFVQKYPEVSEKLGMIGDKAALLRFGEPDWQNYMRLLIEGLAAVGMVGLGFTTTWVFGREFSDNTLKDLLALPVSRGYIVVSKFIAVIVWFSILSAVYLVSGLLGGRLLGLPGYSGEIMARFLHTFIITSGLIIFLCTPVAFLASWSRGYFLPIGFVILTLILANFSGLVGLGPYFPWAIPGLYGNPVNTAGMQLKGISFVILVCTSFAGLAATLYFWQNADHK